MNRVLLLICFLCLSSSALGQQDHRLNYYYYEMDAGPLDVIQLMGNLSVHVLVLDEDNFQKYKNAKPLTEITAGFQGAVQTFPAYVVPPKAAHWYLVVDRNGNPFPNGATFRVLLFSKPKELAVKTS